MDKLFPDSATRRVCEFRAVYDANQVAREIRYRNGVTTSSTNHAEIPKFKTCLDLSEPLTKEAGGHFLPATAEVVLWLIKGGDVEGLFEEVNC